MKTYQELWQSLTPLYEASEAQAIVRLVLEVKYGMTLTDIIGGKVNELSADEGKKLEEIIERLQNAEPVQYVLGQTDFMGMTFHVEPGVLIPRPETAELCQWIIDAEKEKMEKAQLLLHTQDTKRPNMGKGEGLYELRIVDFCTGSGCIAITLNLSIPHSEVMGIDISDKALSVAKQNALQLKAPNIVFDQEDVIQLEKSVEKLYETSDEQIKDSRAACDMIVSNPPYICHKEKADMAKNVLDHEPSIALFVPDEDPLLFYRAIAKIGRYILKPFGTLYFEVNPSYADAIKLMLENQDYKEVEIKEDSFGKKRMIRARKDAFSMCE